MHEPITFAFVHSFIILSYDWSRKVSNSRACICVELNTSKFEINSKQTKQNTPLHCITTRTNLCPLLVDPRRRRHHHHRGPRQLLVYHQTPSSPKSPPVLLCCCRRCRLLLFTKLSAKTSVQLVSFSAQSARTITRSAGQRQWRTEVLKVPRTGEFRPANRDANWPPRGSTRRVGAHFELDHAQ